MAGLCLGNALVVYFCYIVSIMLCDCTVSFQLLMVAIKHLILQKYRYVLCTER